MCKILVLTNTQKMKNRRTVSQVIAKHLQRDHADGFGYAIVGEKGIFGERTVADRFVSRIGLESLLVDKSITMSSEDYNSFGQPSRSRGGAIFHGRTSTNSPGLENAHPIRRNDWTLIHNGVVTNHGPSYPKLTNNDTEDLVHYLSTSGIQGIETHITGYYAVGAFDHNNNLHVIRDSIASLYVATNKTLDCLIFGTTEDLITRVAKDLQWKIGPIDKVKDNIHLVFDQKGNVISNNTFTSRGYGYAESKHASKSLGVRLVDADDYEYENYKGARAWNNIDDVNDELSNMQIEAWREEIQSADASYKFFDWTGREMSYSEFMACDERTKMDCTVVRADGTEVDPEDYYKERLA